MRFSWIALGFTLCAACSVKHGPSIQLHLAASAPATGSTRCKTPDDADGDPLSSSPTTIHDVRVTLVAHHGSDPAKAEFCDRIFNVGSTPPYLKFPADDASSVDVFVEAFGAAAPADPPTAGGVRRIAFGGATGLSPAQASLGTLRLYNSEGFGCNPAQLLFPRAFHTATPLPDGRILFVGGLAADPTNPGDSKFPDQGAAVTNSVEIYDPLAPLNTITQLVGIPPKQQQLTPRAFHSAVVLTSHGACPIGTTAVYLIGGLTHGATTTTTTGPEILNPTHGEQGSRLVPFTQDTIPKPLSAVAAPNEALCLDLATDMATVVSLTGTPAAYRASASDGDVFVNAGGLDFDNMALNTPSFPHDITVFPINGATSLTGTTTNDRRGATLTLLGNGQALMWGGNTYGDPVGEILGDLAATPYSAPLAVSGTASTEFATATLLQQTGDPMVLVSGGFEVQNGGINTQPPVPASAVRLVTVTAGVATAQNVSLGTNASLMTSYDAVCADTTTPGVQRYRPAGYEAAVGIDRGRVLITGGTPSTTTATSHCNDCLNGSSALCPIGQASLYESGVLVPAAPMEVPRFGHTATRLPNGNVLIAGGIGSQPGTTASDQAVFLTDIEEYNPRALVPPYDSSTNSADLDDPIADILAAQPTLSRAPNAQAVTSVNGKKPARSCGSL